jgi:hypothetical protein
MGKMGHNSMVNKQTMGEREREWLNWIIDTTKERKGDLAHQQQWRRGSRGISVRNGWLPLLVSS